MFRLDLRRLIVLVGLAAVVVAVANTLYASFLVQREMLLASTLEDNRVYALKLANLTENFVDGVRHELSVNAGRLSNFELNPQIVGETVSRLQAETDNFNSILAVGADGRVLAAAPASLSPVGSRVDTERIKSALAARAPTLARPFQSTLSHRWQILFTQPIFSQDHRYLGFLAGSLYLHERNALQNLLGVHFYRNGSYLYVVDDTGTLLYHPQTERIGEHITGNAAIDEVIRGRDGQMRVRNSRGIDMLAGFAPVTSTGWGIVMQQSTEQALQKMESLLADTVQNTLPVLLLSLLGIWWLARKIARPLHELARIAKKMDDPEASEQIRDVRSWYFEASQLKRALLSGLWALNHKMHNLRQETTTDPLTGLMNRRGLARTLEQLETSKQPVAAIAIDIDRFKAINDTLGHAAGDAVLRTLAQLMRRTSRSLDFLARPGGEEFLMLLPNAELSDAARIAERLRLAMAAVEHTPGVFITISCGVSHYPSSARDLDSVLKLADSALYQAKNRGRNLTVLIDPSDVSGYRTVTPAP
jgi:diguanylate cyclase (GGDEF)-like protein